MKPSAALYLLLHAKAQEGTDEELAREIALAKAEDAAYWAAVEGKVS